MIVITDKAKCTGCSSCRAVCPVNAIEMQEDENGFVFPIVNQERCVSCGLCEKVCPMLRKDHGIPEVNKTSRPSYYAVQLRSREDLKQVSSGGAFWAFAQTVIAAGGVVYGAVQENVDQISHRRAQTLEEAKALRRSKYFQSDVNRCYNEVKADLKAGRTVLFSGTGCQIGGLNTFLGRSYPNLFTCDVVCHGVPSRKAWESYRHEKEMIASKKIVDLVFRDKSRGWSKNQYRITYDDGTVEYERSVQQLFHAGYLSGLFYRESCGSCPFASMPRTSDITLADYWRYSGKLIDESGDVGVSLVVVNNDRGKMLLELALPYVQCEETAESAAMFSCRHLNENPVENPDREHFLEKMLAEGYHKAAKQYIRTKKNPTLVKRVLRKIKSLWS